jgi:hypothetical protein
MGSTLVMSGDVGPASGALRREPIGVAIVDWPADILLRIGPGTNDSAARVFFSASTLLCMFSGAGAVKCRVLGALSVEIVTKPDERGLGAAETSSLKNVPPSS